MLITEAAIYILVLTSAVLSFQILLSFLGGSLLLERFFDYLMVIIVGVMVILGLATPLTGLFGLYAFFFGCIELTWNMESRKKKPGARKREEDVVEEAEEVECPLCESVFHSTDLSNIICPFCGARGYA